jgi:hypothetical protein
MMTLAQCNNLFSHLQQKQMMKDHQHIQINEKDSIIYASDKNKLYIPTTTGQLFHDDNSFVRVVMGPYGSGKSTLCVNHIVRTACDMPIWSNGRRRARWAIVRNTSGELQSTTLQTWLQWFGDLGDIKKRQKPIMTYEHTFNDGKGVVELELIFIALDRPDDIRKIKSFELTGVYLNELSELPHAVLSHFKGRVNGRYPSKSFCPESYWSGIIADTNPPEEDHWIYNDFENNTSPNYKIFHQPPGLLKDKEGKYIPNPACDNANNLSHDYYTKLAENQKEGFIKVYCLGQYGIVESGKRVYPEYNDDIHSVESIPAIQGEPIHLGWDFGLTPACIVTQFTPRGQLRVLKEYVAEDMGIRTFTKNIVIPGLQRDFPYCKVGESEGDPAGSAGDTIMEELSCIGELNSLGIRTNAASTNDFDVRSASVRYFLNMMVDGKPGLLLSREGCPITRKGFVNGYHFKRLMVANEDRYHDKPNKNKYSHPHDALQYNAMKFASDRIMLEKNPGKPVDMFNPVLRIF